MSHDDFQKAKDAAETELFDIAHALQPYAGSRGKDFGFIDTVMAVMEDSPRMGIPRALAKYGIEDVPEETVSRIGKYLDDLRNMPTEYFETKQLRPVDIGEFNSAVVPHDASPETVKMLEGKGLAVSRYQAGDTVARRQAIEQAAKDQNALFSRSNPPDAFKPDPEEAIAYRAALSKTMASLKTNVPPVELGRTSPVLRALGAKDAPIVISRDVLRKATNGVKHSVPMSAIEHLPEELHDPLAVFRSRTQRDALVALTEDRDAQGQPVVVALDLRPTGNSYEVNRIASVYGKGGNNPFASWAKDGLLAYKSERAVKSPVLKGLQLPNSVSGDHDPNTVFRESDILSNQYSDESVGNGGTLGPESSNILFRRKSKDPADEPGRFTTAKPEKTVSKYDRLEAGINYFDDQILDSFSRLRLQ